MRRGDVVFRGKIEEGRVVGVVGEDVDWWFERVVFLAGWWFTSSWHFWDLGKEDERFNRSLKTREIQ